MNQDVQSLNPYLFIGVSVLPTSEHTHSINLKAMENIKFMTVSQFKAQLNVTSLTVLKSPKTGKLFLSTENGDCYKVQQDIDSSAEMKMLIKDDNISDACLVNVSGGAETQFTL